MSTSTSSPSGLSGCVGSVAVEADGARGHTLVRLHGEIDVSVRDQLARALAEAVAAGRPVVVDLGDVCLLGAAGVSFLAQCRSACSRTGLPCTVRNASGHVAHVLAALDLGALLAPGEVRSLTS